MSFLSISYLPTSADSSSWFLPQECCQQIPGSAAVNWRNPLCSEYCHLPAHLPLTLQISEDTLEARIAFHRESVTSSPACQWTHLQWNPSHWDPHDLRLSSPGVGSVGRQSNRGNGGWTMIDSLYEATLQK